MADPRQELADIIVPAAPAVAESVVGGTLILGSIAGLVAVAAVGLLVWGWRRRRPMRVLHAIAAAAAQRQGSVPELAARLDAWARTAFQLARVEAPMSPPGVDAAAWAGWVKALEPLRFAPPQPEGYAELARLCDSVRAWSRHA